jgi:dTDP-4-dehydrorhamnose reductase
VRDLVAEPAPRAVVDLAAVADIDRAEREPALARAVNVEAAWEIAAACASAGAYCLYFSSDAVFAGTAAGYSEEDPPAPVNHYGRTKAEGERAVLEGIMAGIVRLSGPGLSRDRGQLLRGAGARLKTGQEILPADEIRTPVDVLTLSECVLS